MPGSGTGSDDRSADVIEPKAERDEELVTHKSTRECPMIEPHPRRICGIVKARELLQGKRPEG
jgi:hypothetical protein